MKKKEINSQELRNANGGLGGVDVALITCPKCKTTRDETKYKFRTIGSGCDEETEYTCPDCGHVFTK